MLKATALATLLVFATLPTPASAESPPLGRCDDASQYRLYPDPNVKAGVLYITIENHNQGDLLDLEEWGSRDGATFNELVPGGASLPYEVMMAKVERIVWVGHCTKMLDQPLWGPTGWRLDFVRAW